MTDSFPDRLDMPEGARYTARYPMAMAYAAMKHAAQERKDHWRTPYVGHPVAVSVLVWQHFDPERHAADLAEDLAIAGLLHDVAEDAGGRAALEEIAAMFGLRVAEIVDRCSDALPAPGQAKAPWQQRKQQHISKIGKLADPASPLADPGACLVIACDKLHNVRETAAEYTEQGEAALERFNGGVAGTRWYYRTLRETLAPAIPVRLRDDLDRALRTIEA